MNIARLYRTALLAFLLGYAILLAWHPRQAHEDVWAHAAVGAWIWKHQAVPHETLFLWSASIPWVYHHWLSELTFYGLASTPSPQFAITGFTAILGLAPFVLMAWVWTGRNWLWIAIPAIWILKGMNGRMNPRPELFTALGIAVLLILLSRFPGRLSWKWVAGFFALFAVWANFHGGVILGLPILGATVLAEAVQTRDRQRVTALVVLVALAAIHLTPYGFDYWRAFLPLDSDTFSFILEWQPLWKAAPNLPAEMLIGAGVSGAIAWSVWALSPERRLSQFAWMLVAAFLFIHAVRNISVFIVVNGVVTALNAKAVDLERIRNSLACMRRMSNSTLLPAIVLLHVGFLSIVTLQAAKILMSPDQPLRQDQFTPLQRLHDGSIAFLQQHPLHGRVFCDLENSSYFHWWFRDDLPLFIDCMNAYPDQITYDYLTIIRGGRPAMTAIEEYHIDIVILTVHRIRSVAKLANNLDRSAEWSRVYASGDAVIWVKRKDFGPLIASLGSVRTTPFASLESFIVEPRGQK